MPRHRGALAGAASTQRHPRRRLLGELMGGRGLDEGGGSQSTDNLHLSGRVLRNVYFQVVKA
eukprot:scaffold15113_cov241-Alexandrium_tamarense.AAC.2